MSWISRGPSIEIPTESARRQAEDLPDGSDVTAQTRETMTVTGVRGDRLDVAWGRGVTRSSTDRGELPLEPNGDERDRTDCQ